MCLLVNGCDVKAESLLDAVRRSSYAGGEREGFLAALSRKYRELAIDYYRENLRDVSRTLINRAFHLQISP